MGAADLSQALMAPGRVAINPTDLTAAWPHGGTELGAVTGVALDQRFRTSEGPAGPTEDRNEPVDVLYLGEAWRLSVILREHDNNVLTTLFPNTTAGASGQRYVSARGTVRPGQLLSTRAVQLIFTPDDDDAENAVLFHRAIPALEAQSRMHFTAKAAHAFAAIFIAIEGANGRPADWGYLADIAALL